MAWGDEEDQLNDGLTASLVYGDRGEGIEAQSAPNTSALPGAHPDAGNYSTGEGANASPTKQPGSGAPRFAAAPKETPTSGTTLVPAGASGASGPKLVSTVGGNHSPVYNPGPMPTPPDRHQDQFQKFEQTLQSPAPSRNDAALKPKWYERLAGGISGAMVGFQNPELGVRVGSGVTDRRFNTATENYQNQQATARQGLSDLRAQNQDADQAFEQHVQLRNAGVQDFNTQQKQWQDEQTNRQKQLKTQQLATKAGQKSITDDDGNITGFEDDPNSEAFKSRQVMNDLRVAQKEQADANAALKLAQNDPTSPAFKLAKERAATAASNANAATKRAQAYMLNSTGANLGTDENGNALPGSTQTSEGASMGSRFQGQYTKSQQNVAQFNDVLGATDNLENTAKALVAKHGKGALGTPIVAAALSEPKGTFGKWVQGQVANGNMTPAQRDYVTNLRAFRENLQALRKSAGGGVSDAQVNRLMEMAPGASTPDLDYLLRQTGQIRQTAGRLSEGVPNVTGGRKVRTDSNAPQGGQSGPTRMVTLRAPNGQTKQVPADQVDHYTKRGAKVVN